MNRSFEIEKTNYVKINDTEIKVSTLSEPLRFEVETLDRFLQKRLELYQELEIMELAIKAKRMQLNQMIKEELKLEDPVVSPEPQEPITNV